MTTYKQVFGRDRVKFVRVQRVRYRHLGRACSVWKFNLSRFLLQNPGERSCARGRYCGSIPVRQSEQHKCSIHPVLEVPFGELCNGLLCMVVKSFLIMVSQHSEIRSLPLLPQSEQDTVGARWETDCCCARNNLLWGPLVPVLHPTEQMVGHGCL
jgi:hypothetical protein